jgi:hypothetical protein
VQVAPPLGIQLSIAAFQRKKTSGKEDGVVVGVDFFEHGVDHVHEFDLGDSTELSLWVLLQEPVFCKGNFHQWDVALHPFSDIIKFLDTLY